MDLELALQHRAQVEELRRQHRTGLETLVFTDIVGSTALKQALGDRAAVARIQQHHALVRELLGQFGDAEEISTAGDSFFLVFYRPSDALRFALQLQHRLRDQTRDNAHAIRDRVGVHLGEVVLEQDQGTGRDLHGLHVDLAARVMGLAEAGQILLSRTAFDSARQALKGEDIAGLGDLSWLNHGPYVLKGLEEPLEICEVGETGLAPLKPPADAQKAQRKVSVEEEPVLGWRPAPEQIVPNTQWVLEKKLGEGGFGEVWLGRHRTLKERRVFKFCFRADRVRSLKREMTLFRLLKERVGDHPNIVRLLEVYFEEPPFYLVMDHVEGQDLKTWCEQQGGVEKVQLAARLEIVAQIADALQAAHDAGVIHRDVKPGNILIAERGVRNAESFGVPPSGGREYGPAERKGPANSEPAEAGTPYAAPTDSNIPHSALRSPQLTAKLTDFGIGQVVSEEALKGVTKAGFTETLVASSSSSQTGSQMYMAPELLAGKPASIRSDIYSLGVVLYQLLVGEFTRPVTTDWTDEIRDPLLRDDLKHCFAGNPQERFTGAGQLAKSLRSLAERQRVLSEQEAAITAQAKAAYRRGVIRTASAAALIVIAMAGLVLWAIGSQRKARQVAETRRQELYAAQVSLAQQAWEEGNLERAQSLLDTQRPAANQSDLRGFEWRYLWKLCQDESRLTLATFTNSSLRLGWLGSPRLALSSDGKTLAIASGKLIQLWDFARQREIPSLAGHTNEVWTLAFSPTNPHLLASGADDLTINLWDVTTGEVRATLPGHTNKIAALAFSPDGKTLAVASFDGTVKLWDVATKRLAQSSARHGDRLGGPALCVAFSRDGKIFASGGGDTKVRLWDGSTGRELQRLDGHTAYVLRLDFSPDGRWLATAANDGLVLLWDVASRQAGPPLLGHNGGVQALAFSPDGRILASGGDDHTIRLWSVAASRQTGLLRGHRSTVESVAFSRDGRSLVSVSSDKTVKVWDLVPRHEHNALTNHAGWVQAVALSPDGKMLASSDFHALAVKLWDVQTRRFITNFLGHTGVPGRLAFSPDGKLLASASNWGDRTVRLWDVSQPQAIATHRCEFGIGSIAFSSDGTILAAAGDGLKSWKVSSGQEIELIKSDTRKIGHVAFSAGGRFLATSFQDGKVSLWDAVSGRELTRLKDDSDSISSLACSSNGLFVAVGKSDGSVTLFDVARRRVLPALKGHTGAIHSVVFAPDSKTLASASADGTVKLWSIPAGKIALTIKHVGAITDVSFSGDGNLMATCGADATARLWPAATLEEADAPQPVNTTGR